MANTDIVTALATGLQRKNQYRGNVQSIPVEFSTDGTYSATELVFSEKLPPNCELIGIHLTNTAIASGELDIGYTGDADAIIDGADLTSAGTVNYQGAPVAVGSKVIVGTLTGTFSSGSDSIAGYILIVTDE